MPWDVVKRVVLGLCKPPINVSIYHTHWLKSDWPLLVYLFYQLWASIFALTAADPPHGQGESSLPVGTANLLYILNIAKFKSGAEAKYRVHENELQLQLDLQASTLVADLATRPKFDETELHVTIAARD